MKICDILKENRKLASLEIVPPLKGVSREELLDSVRPFIEFKPPFINVTSHRDEIEYKDLGNGNFSRQIVRRRMSEREVCEAIQREFKIDVVPHLICGGHSSTQIEELLKAFKAFGIENIMALRGDSLLGEKRFTPEPDGYSYASELIGAIKKQFPDDFCIGAGGYPEKHFEAANLEQDILNLKKKVDAGAEFIITQMFFDNSKFYSFVSKCREVGITVPILPGLKPLSSFRQVQMLPQSFSIDIPQELSKEMEKHGGDPTLCYSIGLEWCCAQCEDLLRHGHNAIHFYTMGKAENIVRILAKYF